MTETKPGPRRRVVTVVVYLIATGLLLAPLAVLSNVPGGIIRLELAGSAARAADVRKLASDHQINVALAWDVGFVIGYSAVLIVGLLLFPPAVFRVHGWRAFARPARVVVAVGAGLDLVEDFLLHVALRPGEGWAWRWATAAAWPKFLLLAIVAGYVLVAAGTYLFTPAWVQQQLKRPPLPNVQLRGSRQASGPPATPVGDSVQTVALSEKATRFGIALSGGGVRSAALVLGSLQRLDEEYQSATSGPSWTTAGKVASVSGGSYMAGGWSIARSTRINPGPPVPAPSAESWQANGPEEAYLLDRLGYLVAANPSGRDATPQARKDSDVPGVVATVGMGLLLNATLLFALLWLLVRPYGWLLKSWLVGCASPEACQLQPQSVSTVLIWTGITAVVFLVWVGSGWIRAGCQPGSKPQRLFEWLYSHLRLPMMSLLGVAAALALLLLVGPLLVTAVPDVLQAGSQYLKPAAFLSGAGAIVALVRGMAKTSAWLAPYVGGALFVLLVVLVGISWVTQARLDWTDVRLWLIVLVVWLALYAVMSSEWWSLAAFYRGKLRAAFATYRHQKDPGAPVEVDGYGNGNAPPETVEPSLYELAPRSLAQPEGTPLHICATANVSTRAVRTHYGLPGMSFTMSPDTVRLHVPVNDNGGWQAYACSAKAVEALLYRRGGMRLTSMMAVGMSGAAVSPAMGKFRVGPARALLALTNIRLGVWLPNPAYAAQSPYKGGAPVRPAGPSAVSYPRPRLSYLLKEMFGIFDPLDLYLYVTDGGHWEDTGLVELLRDREIDEVVCFDADESPRDTVTELASAIVLAELECGAKIDINLDVLRSPHDGRRGADYSPQSAAVGTITRGDHFGLLWYAKPVLTATMPQGLLSYAEIDLTYPSTSTLNQFFHTAQFKAYSDLGRHNADEVVKARESLRAALAGQLSWSAFRRAARTPGAHWAVVSLDALVPDVETYDKLRQRFLGAGQDPAVP